ncbi:MAG: ABC transporter permease [Clostridia bacterium]|nr:ABC transporter permease [Clostridia bacterium]
MRRSKQVNEIITVVTSSKFITSILLTLKITLVSTLLSYIIGIPLGVCLYGTSEGSIFPNKYINTVVGFIVNIIRSIPFVILLIMTQPVAKLLVGSKIGDNAFIFHLVIAAAPFVARMIESSFREVDPGVIEAAQSMGSNNFQIITKVILPEAKPSLIIGGAIAVTTILGYTPMASYISGGGLGEYAVNYGLYRSQETKMYIASLLLIIIVQILQESLNFLAKFCDKRIRNK